VMLEFVVPLPMATLAAILLSSRRREAG